MGLWPNLDSQDWMGTLAEGTMRLCKGRHLSVSAPLVLRTAVRPPVEMPQAVLSWAFLEGRQRDSPIAAKS